MSTSIDKSVVELSYDSHLFEFVSATKAVSADTSTPGVVKLEIPGGIPTTKQIRLSMPNQEFLKYISKRKLPLVKGKFM